MKSLLTSIALLCLCAGLALELWCIATVWQGSLQSVNPAAGDLIMHGAASLLTAFSLTSLLASSRSEFNFTLFFFFLVVSCMAPAAGAFCACITAAILSTAGATRDRTSIFVTGNPLLHTAFFSRRNEKPLCEPLITLIAGLHPDKLSSMVLGIKKHIKITGCRALLVRLRQHSDPLVQLHAQAALAEDEEAHERMRMRIEAYLRAYPDNYFGNKAMAELCLSMALRNAGSPENARPHLEKALWHVKAAQKDRPSDVRLLALAAKCHAGLKDNAALRSVCCLLRAADSSSPIAASAGLELAFIERRWDDVTAHTGYFDGNNPSLTAAQAFWLKQGRGD